MQQQAVNSTRKIINCCLLFQQTLFKQFNPKTEQLDKITEQLGDDHDLFILQSELESLEFDFEVSEDEILIKKIENLRDTNLHKLSPRLNDFFVIKTPQNIFVMVFK